MLVFTLLPLLTTAVLAAIPGIPSISVVASGSRRIDVFGVAPDDSIWRKVNPGQYWLPVSGFENMLHGTRTHPSSVSRGPNRIDYFHIGGNRARHKYWDGSNWLPRGRYAQDIGGSFPSGYGLGATSWGPDRVDLVGLGTDGAYWHKALIDGVWEPQWLSLGGSFQCEPAIISIAPGLIDVVGISADTDGSHLLHKSWNNDTGAWDSEWQHLSYEEFIGIPVLSSGAPNRLDVWAADSGNVLHHKIRTSSKWLNGSDLGGSFITAPQVAHRSEGRIDLLGAFQNDTDYKYKFWDGFAWYPSTTGWISKGGNFSTQPAVVSLGPDNLNFFGIDDTGRLRFQRLDKEWFPWATDWYDLGETKNPYNSMLSYDHMEEL